MESGGTHKQRSTANRPDIIIKHKKEKTCILLDVAIPADRNSMHKAAEKKLITRLLVNDQHDAQIPFCIQWKPLIMITLGPTIFDNNNRLITLSGGNNNLHYLTQFIVTTFYMYKKQQNLFKKLM